MNKKEISEIKKQFSPTNSTIHNICGCYVDHEKTKKFVSRRSFLTLSEDESFKYFDIFKKTLSGTIGKNLLTMEFPLEEEMEGGSQRFLYDLIQSNLEDDETLDALYDKIIDSYYCAENYYIILIEASYDVPKKARDGEEMFDSSDEVYKFILCSICPVNLSDAGLSYDPGKGDMSLASRDWIVDMPVKGFLFPAFNDRATDLHSVLYYSKKPEELQNDFITHILGAHIPQSAGSQKDAFSTIIMSSMGEDLNYEAAKSIHEELYELSEIHKEDLEPLTLDKAETQNILEKSGATLEQLEVFDKEFDIITDPKAPLMVNNVTDVNKLKIETPDITISAKSEALERITTQVIDGKKCLVIAVDDNITVNGIPVKTM